MGENMENKKDSRKSPVQAYSYYTPYFVIKQYKGGLYE